MSQIVSRFFFLTLFMLLVAGHTQPARQQKVIVVHGSFSRKLDWWRSGDFFKALQETALSLGYTVDSFAWNAGYTKKEIKRASICLADTIETSMKNHEIILVGHSNGGNVIMAACDELARRPSFMHLNTRIKCVINLATPIPKKHFQPRMDVIQNVINFYSEGDYFVHMLEVVGAFSSRYKKHPRITNIEMFTKNSYGVISKPGHNDMHPADIGRWVLAIPDQMNFQDHPEHRELFWGNFGKIIFSMNEPPIYQMQSADKSKRLEKSKQWLPSPLSDAVRWFIF